LESREILSGFVWVYDKDLISKITKKNRHICGVKQGSQLSHQQEEPGEIWAEISRLTFGQFLHGFLWVFGGEFGVNFP